MALSIVEETETTQYNVMLVVIPTQSYCKVKTIVVHMTPSTSVIERPCVARHHLCELMHYY